MVYFFSFYAMVVMLVMLSMVIMGPPYWWSLLRKIGIAAWSGYVWEARRGAAVTNSIEKLVVVSLGRVGETGFKWHSPSRQDGPIFFEGGVGYREGEEFPVWMLGGFCSPHIFDLKWCRRGSECAFRRFCIFSILLLWQYIGDIAMHRRHQK